jgi:LysM repeat protein
VVKLMAANTTPIHPGQVLDIPWLVKKSGAKVHTSPNSEMKYEEYTVQTDETLEKIAEEYFSSMAALLEMNPDIVDPGRIPKGQKIRIPR